MRLQPAGSVKLLAARRTWSSILAGPPAATQRRLDARRRYRGGVSQPGTSNVRVAASDAVQQNGVVQLVRAPIAVVVLVHTIALTVRSAWPGGPSVVQRLSAHDVGWYVAIATDGYPEVLPEPGQQSPFAFFPAFPVLLRLTAELTGLSAPYASTVLAFVLSIAAVAGVALATAHVLPARQSVLIASVWAILPPAYVLSIGYSESLFVAAAAFALLACLRRRWLLAGAFTGLACVTRPTGVAVALALGVAVVAEVVRERDARPLLGMAVAGVPPLAWLVFLEVRTGAATAWFIAQSAGWAGQPFDALRAGGYALLNPSRVPWYTAVAVLVGLAAVLAVLLLRQTVRNRALLPLTSYSAGILALVLLAGEPTYSAAPRIAWTAWPLLVPLGPALAASRLWLAVLVTAGSLAMIVLGTAAVTGAGAVVP